MLTHAPELTVLTHDGEKVPFASLYSEAPVALVFLRHLGCIFCAEHVEDLKTRPDLNIVFVSMGDVEATKKFREEHQAAQTFLCDPDEDLYKQFGLMNAKMSQAVNFQTVRRGFEAMRKGLRNQPPKQNPMRLGGCFVIDTSGEIVWRHIGAFAGDNCTCQDVANALGRAGRSTQAV